MNFFIVSGLFKSISLTFWPLDVLLDEIRFVLTPNVGVVVGS